MLTALTLLAPLHAFADNSGVDAYEEYGQRLNAAQTIAPLGDSVFGDSVNLYDGSTVFEATDVSLPGNNALPVAVARRFVVRDVRQQPVDGDGLNGFADWDIDVPYIDGTFTQQNGWELLANNQPSTQRCSDNTDQPDMNMSLPGGGTGTAPIVNIWSGNHLHIPGEGDQALLANNQAKSPAYGSAGTYKWVTTGNWRVSCIGSVANMAGEGFVAVSPAGVAYTFNYAVIKPTTTFIWELSANISDEVAQVPRVRIFLLATQVQDRFGNWVKYGYSNGELTSITSSDGRNISLAWSGNTVTSVTSESGTSAQQTWSYGYSTASAVNGNGATLTWPYLSSVTRPDGSKWTYTVVSGSPITTKYNSYDPDYHPKPFCQAQAAPLNPNTGSFVYQVGAPSGASATYSFQYDTDFRGFVPRGCLDEASTNNDYPMDATADFYNFQLIQKQISGPGLAAQNWTYCYDGCVQSDGYGPLYFTASAPFTSIPQGQEPYEPPGDCSTCKTVKTVVVTGPTSITKSTFGIEYARDEGQLLQVEVDDLSGNPLKTTTHIYVSDAQAPNEPFADIAGYDLQFNATDPMGNRNRPVAATTINQDGATFTTSVNSFDAFARTTSETESSSLGYSKTDTTSYQDDLNLWVLGQTASSATNGITVSQTTYTSQDLPYQHYAFGKLVSTKAWNSDGTLASIADGDGNTTVLSNWYRGLPQSVGHADGTSESAAVNGAGWITAVTDENGFTTTYAYDAMGRLAEIDYPQGDDVAWTKTSLSFKPVGAGQYGTAIGSWVQSVQTGSAVTNTYFDAFWRPLVVERFDSSNRSGTLSQVVTNYDAGGRKIYTSYPTNSTTSYTQSLPPGTHTTYDALDRVTEVDQDSELGTLPTKTAYLSGFETQVTDPREYVTVTSYQAYGEPTTQWPVSISAPQGELTTIQRDVFGKPLAMTRTGTASGSPSLSRYYVYDGYQQLCKRIEPESGATAFGYDGAGNLSWSAAGLDLPDTGNCDTSAAEGSGRAATRTYDKRNRLSTVAYPDGSSNASFGYYADGALQSQSVSNGGHPVTTNYYYDKRRLLTQEVLAIPGTSPFTLTYGHDANGHLASTTYPDGRTVGYAPNALGQPTAAGAYAGNATYYPNGDIASFTYGNGLVHTMAENERGLVGRSTDSYNGTAVHDNTYEYDDDGDVKAITTPGNAENVTMTYDGLDRLIEADSPMFGPSGNDQAIYTYSVLDNLQSASVGTYSSVAYSYNADGQLVALVQPGSYYTQHTYTYDVQGNLASKDGEPYQFDMANRLHNVPGVGSYLYDAAGRRVQKNETLYGGTLLDSDYSKAGQLMYQWQPVMQNATDYIYLGDMLVARVVASGAGSPPPAVPATPASITVTPPSDSTGTFAVSWQASTGATSYALWQSTNGGSGDSVYSGASTSTTINGLASGHYVYQVQACNDAGCSGFVTSSAVTVVPAASASITVPANSFTAAVPVSWQASSLATNYVLEEYPYNGGWGVAYEGANTSDTVTVPGSGVFQFQVAACGAGGCSAFTTSGNVTVTLPPSLSASTTSSISGTFTLNWNAVATATSYTLSQNGTAVYTGSGTSWSSNNLGNGSYTYTVQSCNASGCGGAGNPVTVAVNHIPAPSLSASTTSSTNGTFTLTWNAVAGATSYQLYQGGALVYNSTGTSWSSNSLPSGSYTYTVYGCSGSTCGFASNPVTVTVVPASAPSLSGPAWSTGAITLSWNTVAGATRYQLNQNLGGTVTVPYNANGTSWTSGALANGNYTYQVFACNAAGCGPGSNLLPVLVSNQPPAAPTILSAPTRVTDGQAFVVTWSSIVNATSYNLQQTSQTSGVVKIRYSGPNTNSGTLYLGTPLNSYFIYVVQACNVEGCSAWSAPAYVYLYGSTQVAPASGSSVP